MRERQQMASRPFASVAVALDVKGEQANLMQPMVDVSSAHTRTHTHSIVVYHKLEASVDVMSLDFN